MKRVIGIGGIFFKAKHPKTLAKWYQEHLGVPIDESFGGYAFRWDEDHERPDKGYTIWSPFKEDTDYINPSDKDYMFNFIVDDLEALMSTLQTEGVEQVDEVMDSEFGKFAWIMDPEGNKVELWEPKGEE